MKKALILGILGLAAVATQSFGQGNIVFDNYSSTPYMPVMYGSSHGALSGHGITNANYHLDLLYTIGTSGSAATDCGLAVPINPNLSALGNGGYISPVAVAIPGYSSGPITFQVEAWLGATYATATDRGESFAWQESSLTTGTSAGNNFAGLPGPNGAPLVSTQIVSTPEPSIIALCGLGAAAFMVSRRKKA